MSRRGRAWIARVDEPGDEALRAALRDGLAFCRVALRGGWTLLADGSALSPQRVPGLRLDPSVLSALISLGPAASFQLSGPVGGLTGVGADHRDRVVIQPGRSSRLVRYQLSVARLRGEEPLRDRVLAPAALYLADHVAAVARLHGRAQGEPFHGALGLLARAVSVGEPADPDDPRTRVEPLEIADPELVVIDARQVGWGGDELTQGTRPLGALIVADSAVAGDLACCAVLGIDPSSSPSLQLAARWGMGPGRVEDLELGGEPPRAFADAALGERAGPIVGPPPGVEIAWGEGSRAATVVVRSAAAGWRSTATHSGGRPSLGVIVGEAEALPDAKHLILAGDAAIARFARADLYPTTWLRLPRVWRSLPRAVHGFVGAAGARFAWELPGVAPRRDALDLAVFLASRGRLRPILLGEWLRPGRRLWRWLAALQRARRNRGGIPVVHARKIPRLRARSWRLALPPDPRLTPSGIPDAPPPEDEDRP